MEPGGGGAHLNPSTQGAEADLCEFEASLAYRVSSGQQDCYTDETLSQKTKTKHKNIHGSSRTLSVLT